MKLKQAVVALIITVSATGQVLGYSPPTVKVSFGKCTTTPLKETENSPFFSFSTFLLLGNIGTVGYLVSPLTQEVSSTDLRTFSSVSIDDLKTSSYMYTRTPLMKGPYDNSTFQFDLFSAFSKRVDGRIILTIRAFKVETEQEAASVTYSLPKPELTEDCRILPIQNS